jgi:hypothetical protein
MPYSTEIIDNGKGIRHVGNGTVSGQDLMSSASTVLKMIQAGLKPEYALTDLSAVTDFSVSAAEIAKNALLNKDIAGLLPAVRIAIVAPNDVVFGMARMWQAHMDDSGWTSQVFRNRKEALVWLKNEIDR